MNPENIKLLIQSHLPEAFVQVEGDGAHFTANVVSDLFIGKSRIQKQKMVYQAVNTELLDGSLHALSLKTFTTEEWKNLEKGNL